MLKKVDTVRTTCSQPDLIAGFIKGWIKAFNETPKKESIGVLYSQNALETGMTLHMYNWNFGNVKAVDDPNSVVEYCALSGVWEIINGVRVIIPPENPGAWFKSFNSLGDGVAFHLDFLKNHRYKAAWSAIESGNPANFAHLLKMAHYYTAPETDYINGMNSYFRKYMADPTFDTVVAAISAPTVPQDAPVDAPSTVVPVPVDNGQPEPTSAFGGILNSVFSFFKKS